MEIQQAPDGLRLTFDARGFAGPEVDAKLRSGLPQTLVVRALAFQSKGRKPLAMAAQSCRVVYDLWEGSYRVRLAKRGKRRDLVFQTPEQVLEVCLNLRALQLIAAQGVQPTPGRQLQCEVAIELNPMSEATVEQIRRWLSRSPSGELQGDAFFGTFVSVFVGRELGAAERFAAYRSQPWVYKP